MSSASRRDIWIQEGSKEGCKCGLTPLSRQRRVIKCSTLFETDSKGEIPMNRKKMRRIFWLAGVLMPVLCFALAPASVPANPNEPQYVFCFSASINPNIQEFYYSQIFRGDRLNAGKYSNSFSSYLQDTYSDRQPGPVGCRFFNSEYGAKTDLSTLKAASNAQSVQTSWSY